MPIFDMTFNRPLSIDLMKRLTTSWALTSSGKVFAIAASVSKAR